MNGILISSVEAIAETKLVSDVGNWCISYQNSKPIIGLIQDSIISAHSMTQYTEHKFDSWHAKRHFNRVTIDKPLVFEDKQYTAHEIISMCLPTINFEGKPKSYMPDYEMFIKYHEKDKKVIVKRGVLQQGVLDNATIGKDAVGGLFHTIYAEKGASTCINTIYNLQQMFNTFIYYNGITFGLKDVYLSEGIRNDLNFETEKNIAESNKVSAKLNAGKMIAPIDMTITDFYEAQQTNVLEHGDEFKNTIMQGIDTKNNWLYKFVMSGAKGDLSNLTSIYASIGSIGLHGNRIPMSMCDRTSIFFQRFSMDPISRGYCPNSFSTGLMSILFPFAAMEARYELIEIALSTALAGTMNRNAVKNLESISVGNQRGSVKGNRIVQFLFAETGIDPRKVETVIFPSVKLSNQSFKDTYGVKSTQLDKMYRNKDVQAVLDKEYDILIRERDEFRLIMITIEVHQRKSSAVMKDQLRMPINLSRELKNTVELAKESNYTPEPLDPVKAFKQVDTFINDLGYLYMNEIQQKNKAPIPIHIMNATIFLRILIRSHLANAILLMNNIDNIMLSQILDKVAIRISECFMEYGSSVGIIAAQSISEPITQHLLDARHRSGLQKEKTNLITRFDEILKNKTTETMHNPQMTLVVKDEYKNDHAKVLEIANHIEVLAFKRFVSNTQLFMEPFTEPAHPKYKHEKKDIEKFQALNIGEKSPKDLINWCIRFEINQDEMILKSMKIRTIYNMLMKKYPFLYIVYTTKTSQEAGESISGVQHIVRVYIRNSNFKKGIHINIDEILKIKDTLLDTNIRGIKGIYATNVNKLRHTQVNDDGSLSDTHMWAIETDGTNLSEILENPYLNIYECNTTSIEEIERMYGIEAVRNKIIDEILTTGKNKANYEWATIYADEMVYTGKVTSIQRNGMKVRETNNVLLRASFGSPVDVLKQAAINTQTDYIHGMSSPLIIGTCPKYGTTYNDVMIDYERIKELRKDKPVATIESI